MEACQWSETKEHKTTICGEPATKFLSPVSMHLTEELRLPETDEIYLCDIHRRILTARMRAAIKDDATAKIYTNLPSVSGHAMHVLANIRTDPPIPGVHIAHQTVEKDGKTELIRIYMGTLLQGPVLMWTEFGWTNLFSHGDYHKSSAASGGTWSSLGPRSAPYLTLGQAIDGRLDDYELLFNKQAPPHVQDDTDELRKILQPVWDVY